MMVVLRLSVLWILFQLAISKKRVPAEWEKQEAVWFQWPSLDEDSYMSQPMSNVISVVSEYERVNILCSNQRSLERAQSELEENGVNPNHPNIFYYIVKHDNAWMRDNGPVYVNINGKLTIQNWDFDAWGQSFGKTPYKHDNKVPLIVAEMLDLPAENVYIVHERGDLEFNGHGAVIANYEVFRERPGNANMTYDDIKQALAESFGCDTVILLNPGFRPPDDLTGGHIDGIARFINKTTVVVGECTHQSVCKPSGKDAKIQNEAAQAAEDAGFQVIRFPFNGKAQFTTTESGKSVHYEVSSNYMNWLVGNDFIVALSFDNGGPLDQEAIANFEEWFPRRHVHLVDMQGSWIEGGGCHCISNDQPAY
mmetsp:Transcript_1265/g.1707  ORF Transcript_1265/g.1707 Transcript_1265/m.1707 type:complete len:366 (+) Transcript_1265:218-1315(+)|eukprot:CAMPEP_0201483384 /NCGR_PEP_ID=MMETSP0151_2-20130828/7592_1 /ASSEMBLY_ACC=CAM_ASM_000257 /TAXON_ID=200890 /ORGANISM="Paramoeba atlantica, Strain 621/1 / CCAP 1560/9" /LENGTH=365 /DNA_ID=CAMNT_0047866501 /DNA_START=184 /DNA_END=1281 /DNA_ORIENTATION=-